MGIARLVLLGLAVLAFVVLVAFGVLSLIGSLGSDTETPPTPTRAAPSSLASPAGTGRVPTVLVECLREHCPTVFLKVTGGDVLFDREMSPGERFQSFDPKVDVVLADSAAVRVQVNGAARPPAGTGGREEFTATRD